MPKDAPTGFIRRRWEPHVFAGEGIDRRYYELCVLSELRNALRSGDLCLLMGAGDIDELGRSLVRAG